MKTTNEKKVHQKNSSFSDSQKALKVRKKSLYENGEIIFLQEKYRKRFDFAKNLIYSVPILAKGGSHINSSRLRRTSPNR